MPFCLSIERGRGLPEGRGSVEGLVRHVEGSVGNLARIDFVAVGTFHGRKFRYCC
jgi:hypothetical protein